MFDETKNKEYNIDKLYKNVRELKIEWMKGGKVYEKEENRLDYCYL